MLSPSFCSFIFKTKEKNKPYLTWASPTIVLWSEVSPWW